MRHRFEITAIGYRLRNVIFYSRCQLVDGLRCCGLFIDGHHYEPIKPSIDLTLSRCLNILSAITAVVL